MYLKTKINIGQWSCSFIIHLLHVLFIDISSLQNKKKELKKWKSAKYSVRNCNLKTKIIMALADVCGLKTNQLKNSFLSDLGGTSTHLLNDALTSTTNFTVPYGFDVSKRTWDKIHLAIESISNFLVVVKVKENEQFSLNRISAGWESKRIYKS